MMTASANDAPAAGKHCSEKLFIPQAVDVPSLRKKLGKPLMVSLGRGFIVTGDVLEYPGEIAARGQGNMQSRH